MTASVASSVVGVGERASAWLCAGFSLAIAAWFLWETRGFFPLPSSQDVGPGGVPALVASIMALAALSLAAWPARAPAAIALQEPRRVLSTLVLLVSFALGLASSLDPWAVIAGFVFALQLALGERRWRCLCLGTLALTGVVWAVFGWVLNVPL